MVFLYGRLTAENGGFRPGQCLEQGLGNAPEGTLDPPCNVASCVDDVAWAGLDEGFPSFCLNHSQLYGESL